MWVFLKWLYNSIFKFFGNLPELKDRFTMRVITGVITSTHRGNRLDGRESDQQVDFGDDKTNCLISSTDAGLNKKKCRWWSIRDGKWIQVNQRKL